MCYSHNGSQLDNFGVQRPTACRSHSCASLLQGITPCTFCDQYSVPMCASILSGTSKRPTDHVPIRLVLSCTSVPDPQIRIIINDGVVPLTGIRGCPEQRDGMCPVSTFVEAQREIIGETDWGYACHGDWEVPPGPAWNTTIGTPPAPQR